MNCIIIDDEPLAAEVIKKHLELINDLQLVGVFQNPLDAYVSIQSLQVDIIFLDIQMPTMSGFDFINSLSKAPQIILTTAFRDYAKEGFDLDVTDYLVKPISFERFVKAIGKAYRNVKLIQPSVIDQNLSSKEDSLNSDKPFIFFKVEKAMEKVYIDDILYFESLKNYLKIQTTNRTLVTYSSISKMEEKLPDNYFLRVHRSFIVSLKKIERVENAQLLIGNYSIPIGGNYKNEVQKIIKEKLI